MKMLSMASISFFRQANKPAHVIVLVIVAVAAFSQILLWFYIGRAAWKDLSKSINSSKTYKNDQRKP